MAQPLPQAQDSKLLTTSAGVLLTRAINAAAAGRAPLNLKNITVPTRYAISHTGPGTRTVTADQAWTELAERGLVSGTRDSWTPTITEGEVPGHA